MRNKPQNNNSNKDNTFNFYQQVQNYGDRLIKGLSKDITLKQLKKFPLLMTYYHKNTHLIQQRILDTLMRQPSLSDCPGFIYGFRLYQQYLSNPHAQKYDIKMGRTKKQIPQDRIFQWQKDDQHKYVQIFTVRTEHNNKLESLVHLFFAYARKIKYVNGKRRIEWFSFEQKVPNSVVTGLINQLMCRINNLGIINQNKLQIISFDIDKFITDAVKQVKNVQTLIKRLILIGLQKSGKSLVKAMLSGFRIQIKKNQQIHFFQNLTFSYAIKQLELNRNIIELKRKGQNLFIQDKFDLINYLKEQFIYWSQIYNVKQYSIPCLIISFNDILSCQMTGLRQGLSNFLKFIRIVGKHQNQEQQNQNYIINEKNQKELKKKYLETMKTYKLFLVITNFHLPNKIKQIQKNNLINQIKEHIIKNRHLLNQIQLQIVKNAQIQLNFCPNLNQTPKQLKYNVQSFINKIQQHRINQNQREFHTSFQYNLEDENLINLCQEALSFKYQQVGEKIQDYFKLALRKEIRQFEMKKMQEQSNQNQIQMNCVELLSTINQFQLVSHKLSYIKKISDNIFLLKKSKRQNQVYRRMNQLAKIFQIQDENPDKIIFQFLIYCECMIKNRFNTTQTSQKRYQIEQQKQIKIQNFNKINLQPTCEYLSSTLIFKKLQTKFDQLKMQIRDQLNHIIEQFIKNFFQKTIKSLFQSFQEKNQEEKLIFTKIYNILCDIMKLDEIIKNQIQNQFFQKEYLKNQLQEKYLLNYLNELYQLSGEKSVKYINQFQAFQKLFKQVYSIMKFKKLKLVNLMGRIRQSIYLATKNKKPVQFINKQNKNDKNDKNQNRKGQFERNQKNSKKKNNVNQRSNQKTFMEARNNNISFNNNGETIKVIGKGSSKNQKLINYINNKKIMEQQFNLQEHFQKLNLQRQQSQKLISIQKNQNNNEQWQDFEQYSSNDQKQQYYSIVDQQQTISNIQKNLTQNINFDNQDSNNSRNINKNSYPTRSKNKKIMIQKMNQNNQLNQQNLMIEPNILMEYYNQFIDKLKQNILIKNNIQQMILHKFTNLKDFSNNILDSIVTQNLFTLVSLNFQNHFVFNLSSVTFHTNLIILANKITITQLSDISFKIHYQNRKALKINIILIAESYQGIEKLMIQDNKFGKVCIIKILDINSKKIQILPGYYTKNSRNKNKLNQLRIQQLVQVYPKLLK